MVEQLKSKIDIITKDSNQMRAILSSVIEGVIAVDSKQRIILFNSAFRKMFGLNKVKVIERPFWEVLRNEQLNNLLQQVINKGDLQTKELSLFFPEERVFKVHALPIHRRKQNAGAVAVLHDITEIKKIEKMRIDFVANVSHELRTPLTSIKGFIETLKDGAIDDPQNRRRFLEIIESQADRLNNLIADLLQLSKIESKNIAIKFETTDIKELTQQVLANFSKTIQGKGHKIAIKFSEYFPKVKADPVKIEQVLINLISNAVKFTPNGGKIEIKGYCLDNQVKVEICDNGVGIAKEHLGRIFERFYRVDKARSREMGGTGLGLSIVKHIVQAHGGVVGADSQAGKGSCFYFFLPR
jgi:two-component system phosphate regulon sensor histidine kinase PhoR